MESKRNMARGLIAAVVRARGIPLCHARRHDPPSVSGYGVG